MLQLVVASRTVVFAKVCMADLLYAPRGEGRQSYGRWAVVFKSSVGVRYEIRFIALHQAYADRLEGCDS